MGALHRLGGSTSDPDRLGNNVDVILHVLTTTITSSVLLAAHFCTRKGSTLLIQRLCQWCVEAPNLPNHTRCNRLNGKISSQRLT